MAYNIYRYVCFSRDVRKLLPLRDRYGDRSQPLLLNMHMNHGIHITLPDRKVQMYDRDFDTYMRFFERFRTLCEQWIGDGDIRIAVENTDGFRGYEKKSGGIPAPEPRVRINLGYRPFQSHRRKGCSVSPGAFGAADPFSYP